MYFLACSTTIQEALLITSGLGGCYLGVVAGVWLERKEIKMDDRRRLAEFLLMGSSFGSTAAVCTCVCASKINANDHTPQDSFLECK